MEKIIVPIYQLVYAHINTSKKTPCNSRMRRTTWQKQAQSAL